MDNEFMNEYNKHNKKSNIIIFVLIIVFVLLYFGSKFLIMRFDSKVIFADFFDNIFEKIDSNISVIGEEFRNSNIQFASNINLSFDTLNEIELNSIGLNTITQLDIDNNNLFIDYKYMEDSEELFNFQFTYDNQNSYFFFSDLFDKVIKLNSSEDEFNNLLEQWNNNANVNIEDIKKILELTKDIIIDNIDEGNFIRGKENINIENVEYKLDKHSYVLEGDKYTEFVINTLNSVKNNSEYIDLLVNILGINNDDLIDKIDEMIEKENNSNENKKEEFTIYTKGLFSEIVGIGFDYVDNDEQSEFKIKYFNIDNKYKLLIEEEYESFSMDDNSYIFEGHKQDDMVKLTYKNNGELKSNITYKSIGDSFEFVISDSLNEKSLRIYFSSLVEEKLITSNMTIEYSNDDEIIKLEIDNSATPIGEILKLDYDNIIDVNSLTESDELELQDNIEKLMKKSKLFNSLFSTYYNMQNKYLSMYFWVI